jgi:hypothetical protein
MDNLSQEVMVMDETDYNQDLADFRPLAKEQEDAILMLKLNRVQYEPLVREARIK